jgi:cytochrome c biogenesis protein CcmG/thiol:disulfide interchange protein DsbE
VKRGVLWLPLVGFVLLFAVIAGGLFRPADRTVRSALIGKSLPAFVLAPIVPNKPGVANPARGDGPRLLNIFASWCVPCTAEAPQLMRLRRAGVMIEGLAIRDTGPALEAFLRRNGDPYTAIGDDRASAVQLALGSSGVPETFLVDRDGIVRAQYVGDIRPEQVDAIAAAVRALR